MAAPSCLRDLPSLRHTKRHLDLPHTSQRSLAPQTAKQYTLTTTLVAPYQ